MKSPTFHALLKKATSGQNDMVVLHKGFLIVNHGTSADAIEVETGHWATFASVRLAKWTVSIFTRVRGDLNTSSYDTHARRTVNAPNVGKALP